MHIGLVDGAYPLKFAVDPEVMAAFLGLSRSVDAEALEKSPVVLHLCDGQFQTLTSERQ